MILQLPYPEWTVEFTSCRNGIQVASHGNGRDSVILALELCELGARSIDLVAWLVIQGSSLQARTDLIFCTYGKYLFPEPVSCHLVVLIST
jgi:hypothetical protein